MLGQNQPVVFDVPLEKSVSPSKGPVIQRLMKSETASPVTLESIKQKLAKAEELRALEQSKKIGQVSDERLSRARQRRSHFVDEQKTKIRNALDVKMEVAVQKRSQLISVIVQKAQKESEKLDKASQYRQVQEQSMKTKHEISLDKINQTKMKKDKMAEDTALKAKTHTAKVLTAVQVLKEKEALDKKARELYLEQKLMDATNRKNDKIKQKVQTAQLFQKQRSPSKDSPKKED